jgi:hypothetical protein
MAALLYLWQCCSPYGRNAGLNTCRDFVRYAGRMAVWSYGRNAGRMAVMLAALLAVWPCSWPCCWLYDNNEVHNATVAVWLYSNAPST